MVVGGGGLQRVAVGVSSRSLVSSDLVSYIISMYFTDLRDCGLKPS